MTGDRQIEVLRAIVHDYVHTREPVGSQSIATRHHLGVSPATIRNDMAALEEAGLIAQPHTSAGRIPTDAGYRLFVDQLDVRASPIGGGRKAIAQFVGGGIDLDDTPRTHRASPRPTHPPGGRGEVLRPCVGPRFGTWNSCLPPPPGYSHHHFRQRAGGQRTVERARNSPTNSSRSCAHGSTPRAWADGCPNSRGPRRDHRGVPPADHDIVERIVTAIIEALQETWKNGSSSPVPPTSPA